jgi:ferrous iron transport protein A
MAAASDLSSQKNGFSGTIRDLIGDEVLVSRLRELGFICGEVISIQGRAPFGEPIIVSVRGTSVALRKKEAQCIQI